MKIEFDFDEDGLLLKAKELLVEEMKEQIHKPSYDRHLLQMTYKEVCREVIYAEKSKIIDRVVEQATAEVKRCALKKIIEEQMI